MKTKTKIGYIINDLKDLPLWEFLIVNKLVKNDEVELVLLNKKYVNKNDQFINENTNDSVLSKFESKILNSQLSFEKERYEPFEKIGNREERTIMLKGIQSVEFVLKKGRHNIYSVLNSDKIEKEKFDLLIDLDYEYLEPNFLQTLKYGVWTLCIQGSNSSYLKYVGFLEIINKEPGVGISIIQFLSDPKKGRIIDKGFFNRHVASFFQTNTRALYSAGSLLIGGIEKIGFLKTSEVEIQLEVEKEVPNLKLIFLYIIGYYFHLLLGIIKKARINNGVKFKAWTFFIGTGDFMEVDRDLLKPANVPSTEYWADPFLFKYQNETYVFFENYSYHSKVGKISCGLIKNDKVINVLDVLDLDYHLSYPCVFEEDGEIFMIPETSANKRLEIYKCLKFPNDWELFSTAFEGESIVDTTYYKDNQGQKWLFLNKRISKMADNCSELYIYKIDSLDFRNIQSHYLNPVLTDSRVSRNAGTIFKYKGKHYRPSQYNADGVYGKALNINEIIELSIDTYKESRVERYTANIDKGLKTMHHLHQIDDMFVFDAAYAKFE